MYDDLVERLRYCAVSDNQCLECKYRGGSPDGSKMCFDLLMEDAADAIEERDKAALTIQHEMMAEAESHIAQVERLNKQIEELQKNVAYWQAQLTKSMCGETLAELERPRWVSVAERFPEKDGEVLAYYGFNRGDGYLGMMFMQVLNYYAIDPKPHFQHESMGVTVTHWMPLPEPPKEEA